MKRKISALIAVCMLPALLATACNSAPESKPTQTGSTSATQSQAAQPQPDASVAIPDPEPQGQSASFGKVDITIGGAEWVSVSGEKALCVYLDYTNTSDTIIQPSSEVDFYVTQNGDELSESEGDTGEQMAHGENRHRHIFPGVTIRAAVYFITEDDSAEVVITLEDNYEDITGEVTLDPANLPPVVQQPDSSPAIDLVEIDAYLGTEASFHDENEMWAGVDLKLSGHDFIERDGDKYVIIFFDLVAIDNLEEGENEAPYMLTNYFCFQDGVQLGLSAGVDDRNMIQDLYELYPELAMPTVGIGLNEPVTFPAVYRLNSNSDVAVVATSRWSAISDGDDFIGDIIPVE